MTPTGTNAPAVSLITVNFNGGDLIRECIASLTLQNTVSLELIIVDNASTDLSREFLWELSRDNPSVRVVLSEANLGYAGAVNRVLEHCHGRYVGVLNMDIVAEPGWLAPLVEFLDKNPQTAAVNPLIALWDGATVNATGQYLHITGLGSNRGLDESRVASSELPLPVDGLQGAAFLVRKELLVRLGGMDESGFLYHEDVNLSWMLRLMGFDIYCLPSSIVRHDYYLSMHPEKLFLLERNRWTLLLTALEPTSLLAVSPFLLLTEMMTWGYALLRGRAFLSAKARSYSALWQEREARAVRRDEIRQLRTISDWQLLKKMRLGYPWKQFKRLAREKGPPRRPITLPRSSSSS